MSSVPNSAVARRLLNIAIERMKDEPVILLEGARSVGKSTLLRAIADHHKASLLDLDDLATRDAVQTDPALFLRGPSPILIDEYQHVPQLLDAIKAELNRDTRPGRFVLTGSTRWDSAPTGAQSLTGRLHVLPIRPLSQAELTPSAGLLGRLLDEAPVVQDSTPSATTREDYIARIVTGGFPLALTRSEQARNRWIDDHVTASLQRDARELAKIRQAAMLPRLFERLAAQTGQVLNLSRSAAAVGLDQRTASNYLHLLERLFMVEQLPAWGRTLRGRVGTHPKVHVVDSAIAARLLGLSSARLARPDPTVLPEFGHLVETFTYGEIAAQASWHESVRRIGHWRTRDIAEVDIVVERDDGGVIAFEVKAAGRAADADFAGLRQLRELLGSNFLAGLVLYLGDRSYTVEDRLSVVSLDRLWLD